MARKRKAWKQTVTFGDGIAKTDLISTTDMRKFISDAMKANYSVTLTGPSGDTAVFEYVSTDDAST